MVLDDFLRYARRRDSTVPGRSPSEEALSDSSRIITSSLFRRLQTKAQVFSLEQNAAVRSRLTHSLEVACYGRWIAHDIYHKLNSGKHLSNPDLYLPFVLTVENSCLLHDIGNPPFGHLGEYAIQSWIKNNYSTLENEIKKFCGTKGVGYLDSLCQYDGNPQGFRFVTKLQWLNDENGLNLSYPLLASMLKYLKSSPSKQSSAFTSKIGFFSSEKDIVEDVWRFFEMHIDNNGEPNMRYPLTFIMEAADDISYCVSDIEDALEKGVLTENHIFSNCDSMPSIAVEAFSKCNDLNESSAARHSKYIVFKTRIARVLAERASEVFAENVDSICSGQFRQSLLDYHSDTKEVVEYLKDITRKHVFTSREAIHIELSGFHMIHEIMDEMLSLWRLGKEDFCKIMPDCDGTPARNELQKERRLATLLPRRHCLAYRHFVSEEPDMEQYWRLALLIDYISGMTDSHAYKVYRMLKGTNVGLV
ncbi:MAG: dNTP triphosphohydrolase [Rhodothermales bacterium]